MTIQNPDAFSVNQLTILEQAITDAEQIWESQIIGTYNDAVEVFPVTVTGTQLSNILANANSTGYIDSGPFQVSKGGTMRVDRSAIDIYSDFMGYNVIGELLAHEVGHALGINGGNWVANGVYVNGSGKYTGQYGLAQYRRDFDPDAEFIPVEIGTNNAGTNNSHWDQLMRSSGEAGVFDPNNQFALDPRLGITDRQGRDLSLELMTGAIDPDYGPPFLAPFTVQSLRDIGYLVVPEPGSAVLLAGLLALCGMSRRRRVAS